MYRTYVKPLFLFLHRTYSHNNPLKYPSTHWKGFLTDKFLPKVLFLDPQTVSSEMSCHCEFSIIRSTLGFMNSLKSIIYYQIMYSSFYCLIFRFLWNFVILLYDLKCSTWDYFRVFPKHKPIVLFFSFMTQVFFKRFLHLFLLLHQI